MVKNYYAGSQRIAMRVGTGSGRSTGLTWLLTDHLGSTVKAVDALTGAAQEMKYAPWGATRSGSLPTTFRFTGQRAEPGLDGIHYYGARWYDPALGRFLAADTLVPDPYNPLDWDRYTYGLNNPSRYTDPSGHFSEDEIKEYFGVDNWEDVLKIFQKGGELEGRWGWLTVLQKAEIGDDITISWDKDQLPTEHSSVEATFQGKFERDKTGRLIITGENNYMDQMKAAKYGAEYSLMHYTSDDAKKGAAAFLIAATDITVGIPAFILMLSGQPPIMKAAEMIETFVVLPINVLGIKMWRDAEHGKLEGVLNVSAIPDPSLPYRYQEPK